VVLVVAVTVVNRLLLGFIPASSKNLVGFFFQDSVLIVEWIGNAVGYTW